MDPLSLHRIRTLSSDVCTSLIPMNRYYHALWSNFSQRETYEKKSLDGNDCRGTCPLGICSRIGV
ncbi:MAG: hypothetical protein LBI53_00355 [Candidatus Peribacteria bacterium]|nr:hypothetical protein [Candidatus Peribacteria bacterium]